MDDKQHPLSGALHKLGIMRKKRANDSFKNSLRAKLSERASQLEATPKRNWNFRWVPAVSVALVMLIVVQVLVGPGRLNLPIELVNVAEAQDYYTLTPTEEDDSGVDSLAQFTLSSKGELDADDIAEIVSITPETEFRVDQVDKYTVVLVPETSLESGELYQIELAAQNLKDAPYKKTFRWAYSISDAFRVTGTHPGMESTGVPINTGIEISFSHPGMDSEALGEFWDITPEAAGTFTVDQKTATFVPEDELLESTIYTVTLKAGLPLAGTDQALEEDYVWQFETSDDSDTNARLTVDRFVTIAPEETSLIPISAYSKNDEDPLLDVNVYAYSNYEAFVNAAQAYRNTVPVWAHAADEQYRAKSSGLETVMSGSQLAATEQNYRNYLELPRALDTGFYLVETQFGDAWEQSFVQVSNTATYFALSDTQSVFWVNDIVSGEPVKDASITVLGSDLKGKTDGEGVLVLEDTYATLDLEALDRHAIQIQVETEEDTTFHEESFYYSRNESNDLAWSLFETDREVYRSNDTVQFWGMVQGRELPINGEAELWIDEVDEPIFIQIEDGKVFHGSFDLVEASSSYLWVELKMDDTVLLRDSIQAENFVLPAYEISLSTDQDAYFAGETVPLSIDAHFFDGTPVAHTELRVSDPDGKDLYVTTDASGQASASWTSSLRNDKCSETSCSLVYTDGFTVYPVQEELGDVSATHYVDIYRSDVSIDTSQRPTHSRWEFLTYEVDLTQSYGEGLDPFSFYYDHISNTVATHGKVTYSIDRKDTRTVVDDYFDETDKVVRQTTKTETEWVEVQTGTLTPDAKGLYALDYDLDENESYRIYAEVDDGTGGSMKTYFNLNKAQDTYVNPYIYLEEVTNSPQGHSVGDEVEIQATIDEVPVDTAEDRFLFLHSQEGIVDYDLSENGSHEFKFDESHVPNVYVSAVRFDGHAFQNAAYEVIYFDRMDRSMDLTVDVDKDRYAPGDEITVTVDSEKAGSVQIQLVDEAYYALYDEDLYDPLTDIYARLDSDIDATYLSHRAEDVGGDKGGCFVAGTQILMADGSSKAIQDVVVGDEILTRESEFSDQLVAATVSGLHREKVRENLLVNGSFGLTDNHVIFLNGQWTEAKKMKVGDRLLNAQGEWVEIRSIETIQEARVVYNFEVEGKHTYFADGHYVHNDKGGSIRADFPVTAYFDVLETDASGQASVSFELPDSITEWRVSVAAVAPGKDIYAGYNSASVIVSKPAFVVPVLSPTYLEGDQPLIPVRAYGDGLEPGESLSFSLESESIGLGLTADGKAFETSYFETGALKEGTHDFTFGLSSEAGDDAVYLETEVMESYFRLPQQEETTLSEGVKLPGSETSRTAITFLNMENGPVFRNLRWVLWQDGARADEALGRTLAAEWLNEIFGMNEGEIEFHPGLYQDARGNAGGVSLFPYSDISLEVSAEMAALAPEKWNQVALGNYFETTLYSPDVTLTEKMQSLYGLAGIGRNVLLEARVFEREFELTPEDQLWLALTYSEMGAGDDVTRLYLELVEQKWTGEQTMLLATLADYVSSDLRETLYENALKEDSFNLLPSLLYSKQRLSHVSGEAVSFDLNGDTVEIEAGNAAYRSFSSAALKSATISNVDGEIVAISNFWDYQDPTELDDRGGIGIERWYEVGGQRVDTLQSGDIVEIHFRLDVEPETSYRVVDYLPSGLQSLTQSYRSWYDNYLTGPKSPYQKEAQEMNFYVYCDPREGTCNDYEYFYLARVVNPGSFKNEPALMQAFSDLEVRSLTPSSDVTIEP